MKALPNKFYVYPSTAYTTMAAKDLKELLLETEGKIIANGKSWLIHSEKLGAGVYRVTLIRDILTT